jgi:putative glycosyltransferase (TIGR04372 family)
MFLYTKQKIAVCRELGLKRLTLLPIAASLVLLLLLLSKMVKVRVHGVQNTRIGHFTLFTAQTYLKLSEDKSKFCAKGINLYAVGSVASANVFLETMWKRKIPLISGNLGWLIVDLFKRIPENCVYVETFGNDRTGLIIQYPPCLSFYPAEIKLGVNFLKSLEIEDSQKFVCLHVRDSSYLSKSWDYFGYSKGHDWSHHDYRNSEISTFVAAAEALADMGYTVFRMGAIVEKPLNSRHPKVIDYATNGMRSEFLDIFLGAHCTFCVSTGSGWDSIPMIFRRPSLYVNLLPVFAHDCVVRDLLIYPKILQDKVTKNALGLAEIIDRGIQTRHETHHYLSAGAGFRELNSDELVEAVTEMAARVEGTFVETPEQKQMQAKLNHILSNHPKLQPTPNHFPIRAKFASCFLSNYPNFLD